MSEEMVEIYHPLLDVVSKVPKSSLPAWLPRGWEIRNEHELSIDLQQFLKDSQIDRANRKVDKEVSVASSEAIFELPDVEGEEKE